MRRATRGRLAVLVVFLAAFRATPGAARAAIEPTMTVDGRLPLSGF